MQLKVAFSLKFLYVNLEKPNLQMHVTDSEEQRDIYELVGYGNVCDAQNNHPTQTLSYNLPPANPTALLLLTLLLILML